MFAQKIPEKEIDVVEPGCHARKKRIPLDLSRDVKFSTAALETYAFAQWKSVIYDAMVVAAAIEYGDRIVKRYPQGWSRRISLQIPVHDPSHWSAHDVSGALHDTIRFLTGDHWSINFIQRSRDAPSPSQRYLSLPVKTKAVIPYSDGMDSRAVAGIVGASLGDKLVRVRVGSKKWDNPRNDNGWEPFTMVPYKVHFKKSNKESSVRSRGFKFALIGAIAAYLTDADEIVIPESGQGAIGPALVTVGHTHPDYRSHPLFTIRMQRFVEALLEKRLSYVFPRIWSTKGETLREFVSLPGDRNWDGTKSCWRDNRSSSVNGKYRQCGVCAACMLRRVAVHAADLTEPADTYVAVNMGATTLEGALDPGFKGMNRAFREYAIAGFLHLNHLAEMSKEDSLVTRHAALIAPALGLSNEKSREQLTALLMRHAQEWKNYMDSLGQDSFVTRWARGK